MDNQFALNQTCESGTQPSLQVVLMLYDAAIDFLKKAVECAENQDMDTRDQLTCRANNIIVELERVLNLRDGGIVARNLKLLYSFMNRQLIEAAGKNTTKELTDVAQMMSELRESWQHINDMPQASAA